LFCGILDMAMRMIVVDDVDESCSQGLNDE